MQNEENKSGKPTEPIKKAKITLRNILAVIQAYGRKTLNAMGFRIPVHIWEQIIWRRIQVIEKSPKCWESGHCVVCGCEILGKTMEDRACENLSPCYPSMMSAENWKKYKEFNNIKLFN